MDRVQMEHYKGNLDVRRIGIECGLPTRVVYELYVKASKGGIVDNLRQMYGTRHAHFYVDDDFELDGFRIEAITYHETSTRGSLNYTSSRSYQDDTEESGIREFEHIVNIPTVAGSADLATIGLLPNFDFYVNMPSTTDVLERQLQFFITMRLRRILH